MLATKTKTLATCLLFISHFCLGQITALNVGIDLGIQHDFTHHTKNDNGYFLNSQYDFISREFLGKPKYSAFRIELEWKNLWNFCLGSSSFKALDHNAFRIDKYGVKSGQYSETPASKYYLGIGRQFRRKSISVTPSLITSYIKTSYFLFNEVIITSRGGNEDFDQEAKTTAFSDNHFLIGLENTFSWHFNKHLTLNLRFAYNQGLAIATITEKTIVETNGTISRGVQESRFSHFNTSIGASFNLMALKQSSND